MKKTRLLIADDHSIVRDGLRTLFRGTKEFSVVGEAADGETAVRYAAIMKPDVAILDISMPILNGVEATRRIKEKNPNMKVLILTIHEDEEYVYQIIRAGANGYMLKNADKKEILGAVKAVVEGEAFFSPGISRLIIERFIKKAKEHEEVEPHHQGILTTRERQILEFVAHGFTSREIAEKVFLSISTVNTHRANIMQKLNIHDTAGLVRYAMQEGIVKLQSS
jgi:two-component system, NarL family, response regulator NreC